MDNALEQLDREHAAREVSRMKTRAVVVLLGGVIAIAGIGSGVLLISAEDKA